MCEFCHKHGEGQKWYLRAENYSDDLLSDLKRRKFIADFFSGAEEHRRGRTDVRRQQPMPWFVRSVLRPYIVADKRRYTSARCCLLRMLRRSSVSSAI